MKNVIKYVHVSLGFKKLSPAEFVPFCTGVATNLAVDPDVPVAGSPITMAVYNPQIAAVAADLALRKTTSSKTLTADEHIKVGTLQNSTEAIGHYVEITLNNKFPGDVNTITKVMNRIGFQARDHAKAGGRTFEVVDTAQGSATIRT